MSAIENAIALTQLIPCDAERIFARANDADHAKTYASITCVALSQSPHGDVYTFADRSTLTVKGMAMRWDTPETIKSP